MCGPEISPQTSIENEGEQVVTYKGSANLKVNKKERRWEKNWYKNVMIIILMQKNPSSCLN